jgi:tetratricopeptide (TPR) repeat protein
VTTLGTKIRALRQKAGLSQRALAEGLVTKSAISQIESDKIQPSTELLTSIAARLRVRPEQLLPAKNVDQERLACYKQAQAFLTLSHYQEALPLLLECLADPHPSWPLLQLMTQAAFCFQQTGDYQMARTMYERALRQAIREEQSGEVIRLYLRLGEVAQALGQLEVALVEWRRAERELEMHPAPEKELQLAFDVCLYLAGALRMLGGYREALHYYRQALQLAAKGMFEQTRKRAEVLLGLALVLEKLEQYGEAQRHAGEAQRLYGLAKDRRSALLARLLQGRLLREQGRFAEALEVLLDGLKEAEAAGSPELAARACCELGQVRRQMGDVREALSLLQKALQMTCECPVERGLIYSALVGVYGDAGDFQEALAAAEEAMVLLEENQEDLLALYRQLTELCKRQGDYRQASLFAERADELMRLQMRKRGFMV